jgi:type III restriction enzyme
MTAQFFDQPILNSPYNYPLQHWELDSKGQPTHQVMAARRPAEFITPIPKPKKRKAKDTQAELDMMPKVLSGEEQQYHSAIINGVRAEVDKWRSFPTPTTGASPPKPLAAPTLAAPRLQRRAPFFCQVEAVETAIWLTEVAPGKGRIAQSFLDHLHDANEDANPGVMRWP